MKTKILILLTALNFACGNPNGKPRTFVRYDGSMDVAIGKIKNLQNGCISYETNSCGCDDTPVRTVTVCGTYNISNQ